MKKKIMAIIAVLCVAVMALAACGGGGGNSGGGNSGGGDSGGGGKAETYDTGVFTVSVPSGWTVYPQSDIFGEKDENGNYPTDPETIFLAKGASSEFDAYGKPNIRIYWYDPKTTVLDLKSIYDDVTDLEGVTINGVECTGFRGTSLGYTYDMIHYQTDTAQYDFNILVAVEGKDTGVTWEDADIKAIMESVVAQ